MDGGSQPGEPHPHPMARLQAYLRARSIEAHIKCSRISQTRWDCRLTCGPYLTHGDGRTRAKSIYFAAKKMLGLLAEIRSFPWLEQDIRWDDKIEAEANRGFLREILGRIEKRVRGCRYWWNSSSVTLLQEELTCLLRSQGAGIRESIYPGREETLIVWEITANPRIIQAASGQTFNRIKYDLLLETIDSLRTRLDLIEMSECIVI